MKSILLVSMCLLPLSASAGVYKWVDANGQTHFGDRPPAQAASSDVTVDARPAEVDATARQRHQKMTESTRSLAQAHGRCCRAASHFLC